jgi:hypothetical protein
MDLTKRLIRNRVALGFVAALCLAVTVDIARADLVTYNYVGAPFAGMTTPGVTGTLIIDTEGTLPPDGDHGYTITALTLTSADLGWTLTTLSSPSSALYWGSTVQFENGQITTWALGLVNASNDTFIETYGPGYPQYDNARRVVDGEWVQGTSYSAGTWTFVNSSPVPTPLPPSVLLLAPGIVGLIAVRRKLRKRS